MLLTYSSIVLLLLLMLVYSCAVVAFGIALGGIFHTGTNAVRWSLLAWLVSVVVRHCHQPPG